MLCENQHFDGFCISAYNENRTFVVFLISIKSKNNVGYHLHFINISKHKKVMAISKLKSHFKSQLLAARIYLKAVLGSQICILIGSIDSLVRGFCLSSNSLRDTV